MYLFFLNVSSPASYLKIVRKLKCSLFFQVIVPSLSLSLKCVLCRPQRGPRLLVVVSCLHVRSRPHGWACEAGSGLGLGTPAWGTAV